MKYYPLTTPQKNIWNLQKYYADTSIANLCGTIFYQEKRDSTLLQQAIRKFIRNQSGLRLRFCEDNEPRQYIMEEINTDVPVVSFDSEKDFDEYVEKFAKEPIGLIDRPMYCFVVFQMDGKSGILVKLSHLVSDAWTMGLLVNQFDQAYFKLLNNTDDELVEGDYIDFIRSEDYYMHSFRYEKDKAFWEEKYTVRPKESIIKLCPVPPKSIDAKRITRKISLPLEQKIAKYCNTYSVTQAVLFEMAVVIYLSKINPENHKVTIGIPTLNRNNIREKNIAGMFVSTMPLTVEITEAMTVSNLAKQIAKEHMDIFRHQKYPYADILKYLREKQNFSGNLYDVMVSYQNAETDTKANTKWYSNGACEVPFVLHIDNRDGDDSHTINVDYQTAVFEDAEEVYYVIDRLEYIIEQIVEDHTKPIKDICVVPEQELRKLVYDFNDTAVDYPKDKCVHELFTEQVQKTSDKIALIFEDKHFTYQQLDEMSNSLAHLLLEKSVKRNDVVPIIAKRSWHVIVAMLGVLKAGGAYMLIDSQYPDERISYLVHECKANTVLTYDCVFVGLDNIDLEAINYSENTKSLDMVNRTEDTFCAIHTSGSTGLPKAVALSHKNLLNFIDYSSEFFAGVNQSIATTIITFDAFMLETVVALCRQISVVLLNDRQMTDQAEFESVINKYEASFLFQTPTKLLNYIRNSKSCDFLKKVKTFVIGGEVFPQELYDTVKFHNSDCDIYNGYGPAEITMGASFKKIQDGSDITIGKPIANTQIYILDQNKSLLPIGVTGELCISGAGVGKGYLNQPELTAERFLPNPFAAAENGHGKVMYRTGDLAHFRVDGEIEYLGRIDTQVKIRGLRIELGEIESVMGSFSGILLNAVADKRDGNNRQYLVGYYTAEQSIDEKELRQHLATKLPKYMVPNYFVCLDSIPMTSSGKIDRKNLPLPDFIVQTAEYIVPETEIEKRLALIWQELLQVERIGKTDDFFECGGDSLLAITMLNRIEEEFQVTASIKDIMEYTALEQLAEVISCVERKESGITPHHRDKYKILPQQKAIYAACSKAPDDLLYNISTYIPLPPTVSREKLRASIKKVVNKQEALKTYFLVEGDEVYGIYDDSAELVFEKYTNQTFSDFFRPFDLGKAPLIRVGFTEDKLLLDMHHIIADGESMNIMAKDIDCAYSGEELSDSEIQYSDYSAYFAVADFTAHRAFFKEMLKCEFEPVVLPEKKALSESGGRSKVFFLPETVIKGVKTFANENGLTDTMVHFGAFCILLSKYTAKDDILTSVILSNRLHKELQNVVGMFVNTLPAYLSVKGNLKEYFKRTKELILNLFEYQELPFFEIEKTIGIQGKMNINTSFVYQAGEKTLMLEQQELLPGFVDTGTAKFDFSMEVTPLQEGCKVRLEYKRAKYKEEMIDNLFAAYEKILIQFNTPDIKNLADISVLSDKEKNKILVEFNDTAADYPKDKCVHELFTEQVQKTPGKTALIFEDRHFTYSQLDEMSNSLAHFLQEKGVKKNDVVPIVARRSWHMIVAMLGVLKAGGAYMPVDPSYPEERIGYMIKVAKSKIALLYGYKKTLVIEQKDLESFEYFENVEPLENQNKPEDLCYIIFTSGSTGKPKGVALCHRNVNNYCNNNKANNVCHAIIDNNLQKVASVTNIIFDIFVTESWLPLLNGLTIYFANDEEVVHQSKLSRLIQIHDIEILQTTPTKMRSYILNKEDIKYLARLKAIILGGEAFPIDLYHELKKHTDAEIYNIYGPAETTVWSTNAKVISDNITIGTPIANTQIYILDQNQKLLPIGVAGELCIAGEGVGKGYLNQPELTAERFLLNPFATAENGHGKTMYRTGDLARFRADGEIEYLGRIDTQVKIRGLRIELGEIESVMSSFPGILLNAVTDKRDENNRQYLVGYYTAEQPIDDRELRQYLSVKLPKYMVPNYFMHLESIPMTSSGKIDRKNLPLPDFNIQPSVYAPPETEQEKICCHVLEELLSYDQIGVDDDFFEIGGDSLRAIEYLAKLHDKGLRPDLQNIFDYPTVRKLCAFLEKGEEERIEYKASDFDKYHPLLMNNVIDDTDPSFSLNKKSLGNIFLTGATGFLGAHILDSFMKEEKGKVYCLVRSNSQKDGEERIRSILQYYFGNIYDSEIGKRIMPVTGDIERDDIAEEMPSDIQTVIHTAASVKHYGTYSYFERVNVEGTRHIIDYATKFGAKLIHVSTISVSGNSMADDFSVYRSPEEKHFAENTFYIEQPLDNVYVRSKFEAEKAVLDTMLEGLDAKIIRVGNLTNRASDYKFQPNYKQNAFLTRAKAALEFGLFPDYLMKLYSEFSPVDLTAEGVVKIAQYAVKQCIFHLNSNRPIYHDRLLEVLEQLNIHLNVVDKDTFNTALRDTLKSSNTEYIYEAFQNDMDEDGTLLYDSNIRIENEFTVWFLRQIGFEWNETDFEYIRGYIEYFRGIGYLKM